MVIVQTAKTKRKLESITLLKKYEWISVRDRSFFTRYGGLVGFGGVMQKKRLKRGPIPKKQKEGRGGHAKYFSLCTVDMMFYY